MLCHALDFDDTHPESMTDPTTVVLSAMLAVGHATGATGRQLFTALVASTEVIARLGMVAPGAFHEKGSHPTCVCGVSGAVVGVGALRGLDPRTTDRALGLAGSTSAGLWALLEEGTPTKPFHAGRAAHAGFVTTALAEHGAGGSTGVLENRFGLFDALPGARGGRGNRSAARSAPTSPTHRHPRPPARSGDGADQVPHQCRSVLGAERAGRLAAMGLALEDLPARKLSRLTPDQMEND